MHYQTLNEFVAAIRKFTQENDCEFFITNEESALKVGFVAYSGNGFALTPTTFTVRISAFRDSAAVFNEQEQEIITDYLSTKIATVQQQCAYIRVFTRKQ